MCLPVQSAVSGRKCVYAREAVTLLFFFSFSVYIPGNCSAVLLNNETVCVCVRVHTSAAKSLPHESEKCS